MSPEVLAAGAYFVLLDGTPGQIELPLALRGQARSYRIGPADKAYDHAAYTQEDHVFAGNGLRPYSPVHLKARTDGGDIRLSWIRRARIEGDGWDLPDIPVGEAREAYYLRVRVDGSVRRQVEISVPEWIYTPAMQGEDGFSGDGVFEVAQVSDRFGPGAWARASMTA
jgi:hypothetical protein